MNFKKYLPHLYVIGGFFIMVLIYFLPLWQGRSMRQQDIVQYNGMAKEITDNRTKYSEEPFWTNSMFGGMPNTMISMEQYGNLAKPIHNFTTRLIAYPASLIFVSLLCYYIMLLAFDVNMILAALGAIGFTFASFNFISLEAGHNAKIACISYMPLVFAGIVFAFRKNLLLGCALFGLGLALQIVNNHIQITYYLAFICFAYIVVEFYNAFKSRLLPKFIKISAALGITAIIGLGTHAGYFMAINEYSKYSIRGKTELKPLEENKEIVRNDGLDRDYVFNYSNSWSEPFTFLIPDFMGGASQGALGKGSETAKALKENGIDHQNIRQIISSIPLYFGEQPFVAGPIYIGAIICFLFILGLIIVEDKLKWALLACTFIALLLTLGKNFPPLNYFLFDYFPLYNKFRSVTMAVVIPQFCMSLLAVLAVQKIIDTQDKKPLIKGLLIAAGVTGGLSLIVFVLAGTGDYSSPSDAMFQQYPDWFISAIHSDRKSMRTGDALRSFFLIALAGGILYAFIIGKVKETVTLVGLIALVIFDLWFVDKRYLNNENFEKKVMETFYTPTEADQYVLQDTDANYRVFNLENPFNDARTSYFHKSVGGYSPAKLRRYQDLIERKISYEQQQFIENIKKGVVDFKITPVLNMLNTRYILAGQDARSVIVNDSALGNAWYINEVKTVNSPDEEIAALNNFNPKTTAFIDISRFKVAKNTFTTDTNSKVVLTNYKPYQLEYKAKSAMDGFIVFSEVYYPKGWTAMIDGNEAEIKQVNYVLRGLEVPAGEHVISFKMVNESYELGNKIGLICSVLLYVGLIGAVVIGFKQQNNI
jgi:hypothetical protein